MSRTEVHSIDDFLYFLKGVKPAGKDRWLALCSGHHDRKPSLSIKLADRKILIKCFAGCELMDILNPLGLEPKDLFINGGEPGKGVGGYIPGGGPCEPVNTRPNRIEKQLTPPVLTGVNGVTLSALAQVKHLPVDFLKSLGVGDYKNKGKPAVRIPYLSEAGEVAAVRFRLALSRKAQKCFAWRRGDHVMLYGLERLEQLRRIGQPSLIRLAELKQKRQLPYGCGISHIHASVTTISYMWQYSSVSSVLSGQPGLNHNHSFAASS